MTIQKVRINPFTLSVTVTGFLIKDRATSGPFVSLNEIFLNFEGFSVLRRALVLKEIRLKEPFIRIVRHQDYSYNFSDLLVKDTSKEGGPAGPPLFSLNNIQIVNGSVDFRDGPKQTTHTVREVNISVPFLSNIPYYVETHVQPRFSAKINDTQYVVEGETKPFATSRETSLNINIDNLNIPYYLAYLPVETDLRILSALLDVKSRIVFVEEKDKKSSLVVKGDLSLEQVAVNDPQSSPLLRLPRLDISMARVEPLIRHFHLASITIQSPEVHIRRSRDGVLSIQSLFPGTQEAAKAPEAEGPPKVPEAREGGTGQTTTIQLDAINLVQGKFSFTDLNLTRTAPSDTEDSDDAKSAKGAVLKASDIRLTAENLSTNEGSQGTASLSLLINEKGRIETKGSVGLNPLSARLALDVKGLEIRPFQPYFADYVKIDVTSGSVTTSGNLSIGDQKASGLQATYQGDALVSRLSSIDTVHAEEFVTWESLALRGLDVGYNPTYCHIKRTALTGFYARVIVHADATVNLQRAFEGDRTGGEPPPAAQVPPRPAAAEDGSKPSRDVRIEQVTLQGGRINFSDYLVKPNFSLNMTEVAGRISGLSSEVKALGDVELRGKVDQHAPLEIKGKINPLRDDLFVDLKASFKDMELSPVTPYSGKYLGYTIQKGKLSFGVSYLIVKRKLDSHHDVFLDQLEFGEKVESPTATNLPVRLAVALLKNRNGEIRLELPVTGSLDDPQFRVWKVVLQILVNLLTKAATAPFALLGASLGGGQDLSHLEFEYGSAVITEQGANAIDVLTKALYDRPSLRLEIEGHIDAVNDKEGLRQYLFNKKLKVQKFKDRQKQELPAIPVDDLTIEPQEYEKYLTMAYKGEKFPKPRNFLGFAKSLPAPEMEKLMLTHLEVGDEQLRSLASQRAAKVKDVILASGKLEPERVFIVEAKALSPERLEKVRDSRVDFKLR